MSPVMIRIAKLALLGLPLALTGCGLPPIVAALSYAMDGVSYATSGKSVTDHALSAATERDCAIYRVLMGEKICHGGTTGGDSTVLAMVDGPGAGFAPPAGIERSRLPESPSTINDLAFIGIDFAGTGGILNGNAIAASDDHLLETDNRASHAQTITLIRPDEAAQFFDSRTIHPNTAKLMNFPVTTEVYALLQEDGSLELFAHEPTGPNSAGNLRLVARYENFSRNRAALDGLTIDDTYHPIDELMV